MKNRFTQLMNWLHSWSGLLFGWLLFVVFLTGTLTVFDSEITSWMQPELHEVTSDAVPLSLPVREERDVSIGNPFLHMVKLQEKRTFSGQTIDPVTGRMVTFRDTQGGDFFYHFHHGLLLGWPGAWMVGAAAIVMLITLATGVGGHRGMLKDVVMFRLRSYNPRAWLDAHNTRQLLHVRLSDRAVLVLGWRPMAIPSPAVLKRAL